MSEDKPKYETGYKADEGKLRLGLIPPELWEELGKVMTYGAGKYEDRNWERGMDWHRPYDSALRHILAWSKGETLDPESGCHHLASAIANLTFLLTYEARGIGNDDVRGSKPMPSHDTLSDIPGAELDRLFRNARHISVPADARERFKKHGVLD